ncbi:MAG TPA: phytanoyl-CoA dioxygenase family protein [Chitinophagales bacterium]|nr:phytanoyl-CoA dioxygenase family protein [Chitinophagales bacterium]HMU98235.1 phytanoyl-CoA dioxygenase family protein [Chitinophagales bacterium]HMV02746.1 phytanoyl-CoA dioxygenase family protein [Chitinophagales bacterium]HMW94833.1 phytanoyl-CoA dioxygenase family protein [Chitinophagales bacterium]HMZ69487.1 phytanoyl-CoA dioxygenase family protein [Chitinophagales bacterium]
MLNVKDAYHQKLLEINGYFTQQILDNDLAEKIKSIYFANFDNKTTTFYSTSFYPDFELKQKVNQEILNIIQPVLDKNFADYKILGSSFLRKLPNQNNPLPLHQDWTVTDEKKYGSYTIWIPLQDTNQTNGAIRVIDRSHQIDDSMRAPSLPVSFEKERPAFDKYLKTLTLKTGEAFIFNQKLMHASWPNQSNEERLALTIGLVPKEANLFMLYFDKNKGEIQQYSMPDDLFLHYPEIIQQPLIGQLEKTFSYQVPQLSEKQFIQNLNAHCQKYSIMEPLFSNEAHQQFFEQNGYIKLPALEQTEIKTLIDFLYNSGIKKENDFGFYVGMDHEDKTLVAKMMHTIEAVAMPKIAPYLCNYQLITASYVLKDPNPKGVVPPHQDWSFVEDENRHCSVTCWIALVDTDMENGCLGVIKGSNKFFNSVRPSPSPQVPSPLAKHMFSMFPYFQLLPMKAGEALIFDNRTFHASPPNITNNARLAIGLSFTQKNAELRHYYLKPGTKDRLLKYKVDPIFFMKYDNGTLSKMYDAGKLIEGYELMEEIPYKWQDLSKKEMKDMILSAGNQHNKELTQHMTKLFGNYMKENVRDKIKNIIHTFNPLRFLK